MARPFKMKGFPMHSTSPMKDLPHTGLNPPHTEKDHNRKENEDYAKTLNREELMDWRLENSKRKSAETIKNLEAEIEKNKEDIKKRKEARTKKDE